MSQQDYQGIPIEDGEPIKETDERLIAFWDQVEQDQIKFLDEAGKRIIDLITLLLGILFGVVAFGDKFPPPYLDDNLLAQILTLVVLGLFAASLILALVVVQPRKYPRYRHNLTEMRAVLNQILDHKCRWLKIAGILFGLGSLVFAGLIGILILSA